MSYLYPNRKTQNEQKSSGRKLQGFALGTLWGEVASSPTCRIRIRPEVLPATRLGTGRRIIHDSAKGKREDDNYMTNRTRTTLSPSNELGFQTSSGQGLSFPLLFILYSLWHKLRQTSSYWLRALIICV